MSEEEKLFRTVVCSECRVEFAVERIPFAVEFETDPGGTVRIPDSKLPGTFKAACPNGHEDIYSLAFRKTSSDLPAWYESCASGTGLDQKPCSRQMR
jgi:hypothetical protein